ncbi:MAG: TonB-dependent receptor, partial [Gammaproteobacteria bacterium]|nr:TonB-dependent receptor [Gammaproteobacteria bacterium]
DGIGTGKGIANFSIRGLGVAGSIPSIDPTVGVFVDGVYLGVNYGVVMDMLDLEAIEVLRGPQGLLFGRNVTGGAVLLRSRRPGGETTADATLRVETGLDTRFSGSMGGALGDTVDARLSASWRDDRGWFDNDAPGTGPVGAETAWVVRPVLTWRPSALADVTLIYERGDSDGDGPATQNRRRFRGFDFAIDEPGFSRVDWQHAIVEANRRVGSRGGVVTNVFGWREVEHASLADIDSTTDPVFHLFAYTGQRQFSNELRYSGWLRPGWEVTLGAYAFSQDIRYRERRLIRAAWGVPFGGDQDHRTGGVFMNNDIELAPDWLLTVGARYTLEEKDVLVATAGNSACVADSRRCEYDFRDGDTWRNVTPRVGLQFWPGAATQLYGHFTKGFRSGGYNLRNTAPGVAPGPFDEEEQDAFELGLKSELAGGRVRLNVAAFHNRVYGMQRQVTRADVASGGVQITANTADATIQGLEVEMLAALGDRVTLSASLGYTDGAYDRVRFDLNGDGSTVGDDRLDLPRLARLTWGLEGRYAREIGGLGRLSIRVGVSHRDDSEITDDNRGVLDGGDLVDVSVALAPNDRVEVTLYGRNLLDEVLRRSDFDLTGLVYSTYSPLKEGRVVGLEVRAAF